jgi:hypothetical protein
VVAGGEIHPAIHAAGVAPQGLLDEAQVLDEIPPVQGAEHPQAADAVADGYLVGGLLLVSDWTSCTMVWPDWARRCSIQVRAGPAPAPLQAPGQLGHEGADHRRVGAHHVGDHQDQAARVVLDGLDQAVGPGAGQLALDPAGGHPHADAAQVLDHGQPQHDGDRPQLAQFEGDGLVGGHEAAEALGVDPPVAVETVSRAMSYTRGAPGSVGLSARRGRARL